jgi:hypothetical protein
LVHPTPSTPGVTSNASSIFPWSEFLVCLRFACVWHLMLSSALTNISALRTMCLPTLSLTVITPTCMTFDGVRACMCACARARSCVCLCVCVCAVHMLLLRAQEHPRSLHTLLCSSTISIARHHAAHQGTHHALLIGTLNTCCSSGHSPPALTTCCSPSHALREGTPSNRLRCRL